MSMQTLDPLLVVIILLNFYALAASRVRAVIYAVATQGIILGIMQPIVQAEPDLRLWLLVLATISIKGFVIPRTLDYAMREVHIRWQVEPLIPLVPSLLLGAVGTGLAMMFAQTLPLNKEHASNLVVPAALSTVLTGFLILTTRRIALTQILGYIVLENGIFIFGLLLLEAMPFLVEVGVLLDLFVGVFVMGILLHHVNREFSSVSTQELTALKE